MIYLMVAVSLILVIFFVRNILNLFFSMENYNMHRKRLNQLNFNKRKELEVNDLLDKVTKPIITYVFSRFKPRNLEQLQVDLKMAKWDHVFKPIQYRALNLLLKVLGVIAFLLLMNVSMMFAGVWGVILFFGMGFLFNNAIKNRRERLLLDFPEFIRIVGGYLTAGFTFSRAVEESIRYVGDEWRPILKDFAVQCELSSVRDALDLLKTVVDLFEMREFVALAKLTLDEGGSVKDSFEAQAEKIRELQMDMIAIKIGKRQTMGVLLQGPMILTVLVVIGLPTVASMMALSSM